MAKSGFQEHLKSFFRIVERIRQSVNENINIVEYFWIFDCLTNNLEGFSRCLSDLWMGITQAG